MLDDYTYPNDIFNLSTAFKFYKSNQFELNSCYAPLIFYEVVNDIDLSIKDVRVAFGGKHPRDWGIGERFFDCFLSLQSKKKIFDSFMSFPHFYPHEFIFYCNFFLKRFDLFFKEEDVFNLFKEVLLYKNSHSLSYRDDFYVHCSILFCNLNKKYVEEACSLILNSGDFIKSILFYRDDLDDKYYIAGLKSLVRSKGVSLLFCKSVTIEHFMLLPPITRMRSFRSFIGVDDRYFYWSLSGHDGWGSEVEQERTKKAVSDVVNSNIIDKERRNDVLKMLFPVSVKRYKEYSEIVGFFDCLCNIKENGVMKK